MKLRSLIPAAVATALTAVALAAPPASAYQHERDPGTRSIAEVLTSDGNRFDGNPRDYDILTEAVLAVLDAKPDSPVAVLADGTVPLTVFAPDDLSFKLLTAELTGQWYYREGRAFRALVRAVGVDAVESVLLCHVIPGATIDSTAALGSDGAVLDTALAGTTLEVDVKSRWLPVIRLQDNDPNAVDPFLDPTALDINVGNQQIAHGIVFVLRPLDL